MNRNNGDIFNKPQGLIRSNPLHSEHAHNQPRFVCARVPCEGPNLCEAAQAACRSACGMPRPAGASRMPTFQNKYSASAPKITGQHDGRERPDSLARQAYDLRSSVAVFMSASGWTSWTEASFGELASIIVTASRLGIQFSVNSAVVFCHAQVLQRPVVR